MENLVISEFIQTITRKLLQNSQTRTWLILLNSKRQQICHDQKAAAEKLRPPSIIPQTSIQSLLHLNQANGCHVTNQHPSSKGVCVCVFPSIWERRLTMVGIFKMQSVRNLQTDTNNRYHKILRKYGERCHLKHGKFQAGVIWN